MAKAKRMKPMKSNVSSIAQQLGFRILPYVSKKGGKADPKKVCLSAPRGFSGEVQIAALRALTRIKPLGMKVGQSSFRVFFTASQLKKTIGILPLVAA